MLYLDVLILTSSCTWEDCSPMYCHSSNYLSILFNFNVFRYSNQFFNFKSFVTNPTFNVLNAGSRCSSSTWSCSQQSWLLHLSSPLSGLLPSSLPSLSLPSTLLVRNKILFIFFNPLLIFFEDLMNQCFLLKA